MAIKPFDYSGKTQATSSPVKKGGLKPFSYDTSATPPAPKFSVGTFLKDTAKEVVKLPLRAALNIGASVDTVRGMFGNKEAEEKAKAILERGVDSPTFGNLKPIGNTGKGFAADLKDTFGAGLEAASYVPIARVPTLIGQSLKQTAVQTGKAFAKEGAISGGIGGAGHEMQSPESTPGSILKAGAIGTGAGTVLGGALGTATGAITKAIKPFDYTKVVETPKAPASWSELQNSKPELFNTGILRRSIGAQGATDEIPASVHAAQGRWQNYGQYDEIPAKTLYEGGGNNAYKDRSGKTVINNDNYRDTTITDADRRYYEIKDEWDDGSQTWKEATIPNSRLKGELLDSFSTEEGKAYLKKVVEALPKNPDGTITAYRVGATRGDGPQSYTLSEGMAKTFSHQGTDIVPGLPGRPKGGYDDFGHMPANAVKIDPKGIQAWSPYDAEILVNAKYTKPISSPKGSKKVEKSPTKEVKGKVVKPAKAASDINSKLVKQGFDELPEEELASFTPITKEEQTTRVSQLIGKDPAKAQAMATGLEKVPNDIHPQVLFNAVKNKAIQEGNGEVLRSLASSPIAKQRSLAAQSLGASAFDNGDMDAVKAIAQINKARESKIARTSKDTNVLRKDTIKQAKTELKRTKPTKQSVSSFIESLTC